MKTKIFFSLLFLMAATVALNAQDLKSNQSTAANPPYGRGVYVDANNDGVCDYFPARAGNMRNVRANAVTPGPGFGAGRNLASGQGRGIAAGRGRGMGPGKGQGLQPGGRFYVDADKNGVCDHFEKPAEK